MPDLGLQGERTEPAGIAGLPRRVAEFSHLQRDGHVGLLCFQRDGSTKLQKPNISKDRTCDLPSMPLRELSGSEVAVSLLTRIAAFFPRAASVWHPSSIVTQAAHG